MAVPWGLVIFLVGIAYGYMVKGKTDKSEVFKKGLLWGVVVAIVVALLGFLFNVNPLGLGDAGFLGIVLSFVVLTLLFILGVWIGDWIESRREPSGTAMRRT